MIAAATSVGLEDIERATTEFAEARAELISAANELQRQLDAVVAIHEIRMRRLAERQEERARSLRVLLAFAKHLFDKPRTRIYAGIKVGFAKGKGVMEIADEGKTIGLIQRYHFDQFDVLVKSTMAPVKKALAQLSAAELKRLGVTVTDTGDEIVVAPVERDADALVAKLIDLVGDEK